MKRLFRSVRRRDEGLAMIAVAMLGTALVLISAAVFARGLSQFSNTSGDAAWEQALGTAEAGLDWGLDALDLDETYTTGETVPEEVIGTAQEKKWAVGAADERAADAATTPAGEFVVVKPTNGQFLYSVGFTPTQDSPTRRVRAVRVNYDYLPYAAEWIANYAFLAGDDLTFRGAPVFLVGYSIGIHTNGYLDVGGSTFTDGCISASGGAVMSGGFTQPPGCAVPGAQPEVFVPEVNPRDHWEHSQFDLCPDGKVRAGPAHAVYGNTATSVPCQGQTLHNNATSPGRYQGWRYLGCCSALDGALWRYDDTQAQDGVYYVYLGSAQVQSQPGTELVPWNVGIFAEANGVCANLVGGDIIFQGAAHMQPYEGVGNIQMMAGRDVDMSGGSHFSGIVAAHEQIEADGNGTTVNEGGFLAQGACESLTDRIDESYVAGNVYVQNTGPVLTEIGATIDLLTATSWTEL
jgi:hypothetical protein